MLLPLRRTVHILLTASLVMVLLLAAASAQAAPVEITGPTVITEPGTYVLTQDILDCAPEGACIYIFSSHVVFDGMGHTIAGLQNGGLHGIAAGVGIEDVTVRNVVLEHWGDSVSGGSGMHFNGVIGGLIERVFARDNSLGIALIGGTSEVIIRDCDVVDEMGGIYLGGVKANQILDSRVTGWALTLDASSGNTLVNNTLTEANFLLANGCHDNVIRGNRVHNTDPVNQPEVSIFILGDSPGNLIYDNSFMSTLTAGGFDETTGSNAFSVTPIPGMNIRGGSTIAGNAWLKPDGTGFSQTCADDDGDGFCDEPYDLGGGNVDEHPLSARFQVSGVTIPTTPVAAVAPVSASATFSDVDTVGGHVATFSWGDGTTSIGTIEGTPLTGASVAGTHAYSAAGIYQVSLAVTDDDGPGTGTAPGFLVVYDPVGGFVTGGGRIVSPAGAYGIDPDMTGTATFAFVSRYRKGATVPSGTTQFLFKAADFMFRSTSYDWLVVAGTKAQYRGSGTVNGRGGYGFLLTAVDATPDRFRLKVWEKGTDTVVYDNQAGAGDGADPATAISGGSIVVQKK